MKTTLFLPVVDEIEGVKAIMPRIDRSWVDEIVVIDGNSTDGTFEWFGDNGFPVFRQRSRGICGAYWECLEVATGDIIIPFSPDNNSIPEIIPELVAAMKQGYDMVIVSRYTGGAKSHDDDRITALGNWLFTKATNLLFGARYTDVLVMFRAFRRSLVSRLELDWKSYPVFELQLCIRCAKRKMRVKDIPGDEPKRIGGVRKMRPLYNGSALLLLIIRELFAWR